MKTNFDKLYKMDTDLEKEGVWIEFPNGAGFKVRRFGGTNSQKLRSVVTTITKPLSRQIEMGTLTEEQERKVMVESFVKACLIDWRNVSIDDKEVPYSEVKAIELFMELPELFTVLSKQSENKDNYKSEVGNG